MLHSARSPHTSRCPMSDHPGPAADGPGMRNGFIDDLIAEIARLQGLISEYAYARHWTARARAGEACTCEGCELLGDLGPVREVPHA